MVQSQGGVAHRAVLQRMRVSAYHVRAALDAGTVFRVGRHRVSTRGCPPHLLRAVSLGGKLTCVSAAQHRGLWSFDDERLHIAVSPTHSPKSLDGRLPLPMLHWGIGPVPVDPTLTIEPGINMLVHIARCQPLELAVAIFDSAINMRFITLAELRRLGRSVGGCVASVVSECDGGADSGIESLMRVRVGARGIQMRIQVTIDGHDVDGLIGERLVIQADGYGPHSTSPQRSRDLKQDARLVVQGYTVLRFSYAQILYDWPYVEGEIMASIAQRLHMWERR